MSLDPRTQITRDAAGRGGAMLCLALLCAGGIFVPSVTGWAQQNGSSEDAPSSRDPAQSRRGASDSRRVLHEYFDPWSVQLSGRASARTDASSGDARPSAIPGAPGQPPGLSLQPATDEMILGAQGPVDAGATTTPWGPLDPGAGAPSRLDSATDRVDQLNYWASFEPSVVPYKRVVVQNQVRSVDGEYSLHLDAGRFSGVTIQGGAQRGDEDVFWGSFLVRARGGERHPIPSVAPGQRILSVQVAPMMGLRIERNEADNFYIVPASDGLLRVNMKVAAPRDYFSGALSEKITWRHFTQIPERRDTRLSGPIMGVATDVLKLSGASTEMAPRDALYTLIEYHRDFEARPFPDALAQDDLYVAISREQVGVCRHRSLAFVISARALGIPARYIYNEAHAFVEIYWPKMGWRRIDLGGAADQLDYAGPRGGGVHQAAPDAFPQPPNYISELERMGVDVSSFGGDGSGDDGESAAESTQRSADAKSETNGQEAPITEAEGGGDETGEGAPEEQLVASEALEDGVDAQDGDALATEVDQLEAQAQTPADPEPQVDGSGVDEPQVDEPEVEADPRRAVRIDVVAGNPDIFRGTALGLNGSIFSVQGRPISRAALKVYLGPVGVESTEGLVLLGELESDAGGRFEGQFAIPDDIAIGRWSVILRYEGNEKYLPAQVD